MKRSAVVLALLLSGVPAAYGDVAPPLTALANLPVREITSFKDGYVFVLHEGPMPVDANGDIAMDYLPTPVLGTFWPYSIDSRAKLAAVTASQHRVMVEHTALTLRELLEANPGAQVGITQVDGHGYGAQIVGIPERSSDELERTSPPGTGTQLPVKAGVILLKTVDGTSVINMDNIKDVTFKGAYRKTIGQEEIRNLLTLRLNWQGGARTQTANVGMMYVQPGIRWIPAYRVTLDGKGTAQVRMEATLINELTDLKDVAANLVVGVPSFAFRDTTDPISMQQTFAQLSSYFDRDSRSGNVFAKAMMTQAGRSMTAEADASGGFPGGGGPRGPLPEMGGAAGAEDLFVYNVKHVSLKKGERMVLPVSETSQAYEDIYTVEVPFAPPQVIMNSVSGDQQMEIARMLSDPMAMHKIRFVNKSAQPYTTAPALILEGSRVLAQGMMAYTAPGAHTDLPITGDPNIKIEKSDRETGRTPDAAVWQDVHYGRVDAAGEIKVTNFGQKTTSIEVTRNVYGAVDSAGSGGVTTMENVLEMARGQNYYSQWPWPDWWRHFNGLGKIVWHVSLAPGKSATLPYTWHYFAR